MTKLKDLGQDATAGDLEDFIDQCERIMDEGFSEEEAIDIVWHDGSIDLNVRAGRVGPLDFIRYSGTESVLGYFTNVHAGNRRDSFRLTPDQCRTLGYLFG